MSYKEKRTIVSIVTGILILLAYSIYAYSRYRSGMVTQGDLQFWAGTILTFIVIGIVVTIIIHIIFHILLSVSIAVTKTIKNEKVEDKEIEKSINLEMVEDEMDKLIDLKSTRAGFIFVGIGFVVSLVTLVLNYSPVVMLNILFFSFMIGSLFEGFAQLYFYRRGI
jgi:hypothetical protein